MPSGYLPPASRVFKGTVVRAKAFKERALPSEAVTRTFFVDSKGRARYTVLVRRLHPDANGGDRAGEVRLQRVIRAYQSLRKAGMV